MHGYKRYYFLLFVIYFFLFGIFIYAKNNPAEYYQILLSSNPLSFNVQDPRLSQIVEANLKDVEGEFSIVIEDLEEGSQKSYSYNPDSVFPSASLYKIFVIAAVYQEIENGNLKIDEVVGNSKAGLTEQLGELDYGYDQWEGDRIEYSVEEALRRVAENSDNFASLILANKVSWEKVQEQANKIGATSTTIKSPISTSASDIALFFKKLYKKQIVSESASGEIIDLLARAKINNRIPGKLPEGLKIAHKTGELARIRHDAGIVFLEGNPYLIVLMSQNLKGEDDGIEALANISGGAYDYFSSEISKSGQ